MRCAIAQKNAVLTNCQTAADAGFCYCKITVRAAGVRDVMRWISIVKPSRCINVSNLFYWSNTLHVSDGLSVQHQEFKTAHTETGICQTDTALCLLVGTR